MDRMEKWVSSLFISMITIIITLVMIEVAANHYLWNIASIEEFNVYASVNQFHERYDITTDAKFIPHHYLPYVPNPNYKTGSNRHNSLGFRGDEITLEKPEGVYRIVCIGGSTTYGSGVQRYDRSYPYRLKEFFHKEGYTNVEVVNAGIPGATSHESLMNLQFRVLELDPDLIIVYHATNDAHTRLVIPPSAYRADNSGYRAPLVDETYMPNILEYSTALRIIGINLGWFKPQNALENLEAKHPPSSVSELFFDIWEGRTTSNIFDEMSPMEIIEANPPQFFESNLKSIIGIANIHHVDVMLTTWAYSPEFIHEARAASDEYKLMYQQHNDLIRAVAEETGAYFYDFVLDMPTDAEFFTDGRHMSRKGNHTKAKLFGTYIIENILTDKHILEG